MVIERKIEDISLLYICEGDCMSEEFILSAGNSVRKLTIGKSLNDAPSILDSVDVDVLLLDIDPGRIQADNLNSFLIKMREKNSGLSAVIVTRPGEFADNLTEADFVVSRNLSCEQMKRLIEYC